MRGPAVTFRRSKIVVDFRDQVLDEAGDPGYPVKVFSQKNLFSGAIADMTRNAPPLRGRSALMRGITTPPPAACCRRASSTRRQAINMMPATSASESSRTISIISVMSNRTTTW
jgi:hypothetical protein